MLAVVYIDLDGFKEINDHYGHGTGDQLLISISQKMSDALRECDTLARIGGDEFVAMLADLETPNDCKPVLDRLQKAAAETVTLGDVLLNVSASMGVSLYPQSGNNADLLLRQADQAMYIAKESGKDRYHFFDVNSVVEARVLRENLYEVRHALAQGEFVLHYQPKINMRSLKVVGMEALIRWRHPEKGLLEPNDFLPFIENHPIRIQLGTWVINTALTQISQWHERGLQLPVSVNVGAYQLQDKNFFEQLTTALAAHKNFKPGQLELEILETSALENMTYVSSLIIACKKVGVSFSLDDFGTGYSSLTYLKRLPSASIKIDQSFVQDMLTNSDDLAIVQGVIGLAEVFGRSVIAEGVESAAHSAKLLSMNCEIGQGFGIARPMPAADVPQWVSNWHTNPIWKA
jgi:diguanylate cyclase (GGDEF)-like protein